MRAKYVHAEATMKAKRTRQRVYQFVRRELLAGRTSPPYRTIASKLGIASTSQIGTHIHALIRAGKLEKVPDTFYLLRLPRPPQVRYVVESQRLETLVDLEGSLFKRKEGAPLRCLGDEGVCSDRAAALEILEQAAQEVLRLAFYDPAVLLWQTKRGIITGFDVLAPRRGVVHECRIVRIVI